MMGYAFDRADLARGAELAELDTDDLAERDAAGLFRIKGRAGRFSKIGGVRLGHDALEAALASHGLSAAVFGDDRQVTVVHEPVPAGLSDAELQALVLRLAGLGRSHLTCRAVSALPRLPSGKVDYAALRQAPGLHPRGWARRCGTVSIPIPSARATVLNGWAAIPAPCRDDAGSGTQPWPCPRRLGTPDTGRA
ncbi:hypothetical protein ACFSHQ_09500 [Gemmobacter lanyuensis]